MRHFLLCVAAGLALAGCSKEQAAACSSTQLGGTWVGGGRTYEFNTSCQFTLVEGACAASGLFTEVGQTVSFDYVESNASCDPLIEVSGDTFSYSRSGASLTLNGISYTLQ